MRSRRRREGRTNDNRTGTTRTYAARRQSWIVNMQISGGGGGGYSGPKEIKYLFIGGGCISTVLDRISATFAGGAVLDLNYEALTSNYSKVFYYDALPERKSYEDPARVVFRGSSCRAVRCWGPRCARACVRKAHGSKFSRKRYFTEADILELMKGGKATCSESSNGPARQTSTPAGHTLVSLKAQRTRRLGDECRLERLHWLQCLRCRLPGREQYSRRRQRAGGSRARDALAAHRPLLRGKPRCAR
jgi:hypothetical protein